MEQPRRPTTRSCSSASGRSATACGSSLVDDPDRARLRPRLVGAARTARSSSRCSPARLVSTCARARRLPAATIVRSRWREHFFLVWTAADVALIAAIVSADGGSRSVLGAIFFLPLIFGSLSYPTRSVAICGVMSVCAYAVAALLAGGAEADAVGGLLRPPRRGRGDGRLPGVEPRAPAARARAALALGPADGLPQPPRLHRALRGGAVGPRAPRRSPARPDRDRPRRLQGRQRHPGTRGGRRPAVPRRGRARAPTCGPPTSSAASAGTSSRCCCPRRARRAAGRRRAARPASPAGERRLARPRVACRPTARPPRSCTAAPTRTSTAPSSARARRRVAVRRRAPARSPSAGPRRCPRRW